MIDSISAVFQIKITSEIDVEEEKVGHAGPEASKIKKTSLIHGNSIRKVIGS